VVDFHVVYYPGGFPSGIFHVMVFLFWMSVLVRGFFISVVFPGGVVLLFSMCSLVSCSVVCICLPFLLRFLFLGMYGLYMVLLFCLIFWLVFSLPSCPFAPAPHIAMWRLGVSASVLLTASQWVFFSWLLYSWCGA